MDRTLLRPAYRLISELFIYPEDRDAARIEAEMAALEEAPAELRAPLEAFLAAPGSVSVEEYVAPLELANIYRHFGVELAGGEMADFVPVVVDFLGISLECEERDRIGLRRYLVETLLINGIESLSSALQKCESPYAHLVEALRAVLAEDIQRMAGGPKWQPPAIDDHPRVPAAVRGLMATDRTTTEIEVEQ